MVGEKSILPSQESKEKEAIGGFLKAVVIGTGICELIAVSVFLIIGKLSLSVLLGALYGGVIMILNYFFMAKGVAKAAKEQDPETAKKLVQMSYSNRALMLVVLFGIGLFLSSQYGFIHWLPMVLSLLYPRIALGIWQQRYKITAKKEQLIEVDPQAYSDIDRKAKEADL